MSNTRMIDCPTCHGDGNANGTWCSDCGGDGEIDNPDYDPSPCCSGVATGGSKADCNCNLKTAENN